VHTYQNHHLVLGWLATHWDRIDVVWCAGGVDPATVTQTLRSTLSALNALSHNRAALEEKIKATKDADNVLPELLQVGPDGADAVFAAHLAQYDGVKVRTFRVLTDA
jgi:hypothetical protein